MGVEPQSPNFEGAKLKLERARKHIASLNQRVGEFFAGYPHSVSQVANLREEKFGWEVTLNRPLPSELGIIIGDAVHNLRASLDHLIASAALANGESAESTMFPFPFRKSSLEFRLKKDVYKAGPIAMQLVRQLRPYPHGNPDLWAVHKLDIIDKHRLILPVACATDVTFSLGPWSGKSVAEATGTLYYFRKKKLFIHSPQGYEFELPTKIQFSGEIVFAKEGRLGGQPCGRALGRLSDVVSKVIDEFESAYCSAS